MCSLGPGASALISNASIKPPHCYERTDIRAHVLRHSFCTFVAESDIAPNEAAALTGHDLQTWWKSYVQPRKDAQSRKEFVKKLTARGLGVQPEVDQKLTSGS